LVGAAGLVGAAAIAAALLAAHVPLLALLVLSLSALLALLALPPLLALLALSLLALLLPSGLLLLVLLPSRLALLVPLAPLALLIVVRLASGIAIRHGLGSVCRKRPPSGGARLPTRNNRAGDGRRGDVRSAGKGIGGVEGDRTLDLRIANATLSQLSYHPTRRAQL
jgi:hypothetical protein